MGVMVVIITIRMIHSPRGINITAGLIILTYLVYHYHLILNIIFQDMRVGKDLLNIIIMHMD